MIADAFREVGYCMDGSGPVGGLIVFVLGKSRFHHYVMPDGTIDLALFFQSLDRAVKILSIRDPEIPAQLSAGISLALEGEYSSD